MMANRYVVKACITVLILLFSQLGACASMAKYELQATEGAPKGYPMQIITGDLHYHDGSGSLYVPEGALLYNGWGNGRSSHVVGDDKKPLPDRLHIVFFSYTENQFYEGDFKLPYEKIASLFQAGFYSPNLEKHTTYHKIVVGVAPGGVVSVWLWKIEKRTEIFFGKAKKIEGNWKWINDNPKYTREEYVRLGIEDVLKTKEAIEAYHKNGVPFGLWEKYHKARYHWVPVFTNMPLYDKRISLIEYFNGEIDYLDYPLSKGIVEQTRAVPKKITYVWDQPYGKPLMLELFFDEKSIFKLFEKMARPGETLKFEFRVVEKDGKNDFTMWLKNDKDAVEIKDFRVETYGIPDRAPQLSH